MRIAMVFLAMLGIGSFVLADDAEGDARTVAYLRKLQTPGGGFTAMPPAPNIRIAPTLRATSAASRTIGYLGGQVPDREAARKFVASCYDAKSGGFADFPGGTPDVPTTVVGILAVGELGLPIEDYSDGVTKFLAEAAKSFEEIRVAAAGMERLKRRSPKTDVWLAEVKKLRNADGTFGSGLGQARDTGGSAVVLLRLGEALTDRDNVVKAMRDGQRPSGGFGRADSELDADLETSYRVMRCFMMLKEKPARVEGLRTYVAKCRNEDGGYGMSPGEPSTAIATYFAISVRRWLE